MDLYPHVSGWHAQVQLYLQFAFAGQQEIYVFSFVNTFHVEVYQCFAVTVKWCDRM